MHICTLLDMRGKERYVRAVLDSCDRLVYHATMESHAMSAESSERNRSKKKDSKMEIVNSFPADPWKMCAVPIKTTLAKPEY